MASQSITKWYEKGMEKVKDVTPGLHDDGPNWKPTSNERNNSMLQEARTYSWALMALHRDLISWDKNAKITLISISTVLRASLPRVFDEAHSGAAFPSTREHKVVAGDVPTEVLNGAAAKLHEKMMLDVLHPLEQWLEAYKRIRSDNDKVEALRQELDLQRRHHAQTQYKVDKLAAKASSPMTSPRDGETADPAYEAVADKLEATAVKLEKREDQTSRMAQRYAEAELHVYNSLCALIQDVSVLRDYCAAAITLMQRTFTSSLRAFQDGERAVLEEFTLPWHTGLGARPTRSIPVRSPLQASRAASATASRAPSMSGGPSITLLSPVSANTPALSAASHAAPSTPASAPPRFDAGSPGVSVTSTPFSVDAPAFSPRPAA